MVKLRWTREGVRFTDHSRNFTATAGEYDVSDEQADEYLAHHSAGWERVEDDDSDSGETESTDEPETIDPSDYTLDELEDVLDGTDADSETLHDLEGEGDDRKGAHEIIDAVAGE